MLSWIARLSPEAKTAACDWFSGLIIGLMPITAHGLLHFAATTDPEWDATWSPDILIIAISNSGLSCVTIFSRLLRGTVQLNVLNKGTSVLMALTIAFCGGAAVVYGTVVSGMGNPNTIWASIVLMLCSVVVSLMLELALAARAPVVSTAVR